MNIWQKLILFGHRLRNIHTRRFSLLCQKMIHPHHRPKRIPIESHIRNKHRILSGEQKIINTFVGEKFHGEGLRGMRGRAGKRQTRDLRDYQAITRTSIIVYNPIIHFKSFRPLSPLQPFKPSPPSSFPKKTTPPQQRDRVRKWAEIGRVTGWGTRRRAWRPGSTPSSRRP